MPGGSEFSKMFPVGFLAGKRRQTCQAGPIFQELNDTQVAQDSMALGGWLDSWVKACQV